MSGTENNSGFFDGARFGEIIAQRRRLPNSRYDFRSGEGFLGAVEEITGYKFKSQSSYYRAQRGERDFTLSEFLAIAVTLYGSVASEELYEDVLACMGHKTRHLEKVAHDIRREVALNALMETARSLRYDYFADDEEEPSDEPGESPF